MKGIDVNKVILTISSVLLVVMVSGFVYLWAHTDDGAPICPQQLPQVQQDFPHNTDGC